jgi:hypothetical protein
MPEGSLHITKLSRHPPLYAVAFIPRRGAVSGLSWRECPTLEDLRGLLTSAGVAREAIAPALHNVNQGDAVSIRRVVLNEAVLERLGLRTTERPGTR